MIGVRDPKATRIRNNVLVRIVDEVREAIDVNNTVRTELSGQNPLLPLKWADLALLSEVERVSTWFSAVSRRELKITPEDIVLARKVGRGARPISILGLAERLIYRGAVSLVSDLVEGDTSRGAAAYHEFQVAPANEADTSYVLRTDIASFYQYIDHELLVDETIAQTGSDLAVAVAVELLSQTSGRSYGLPQANSASDVLAEIYIEPLRRRLAREGFRVFRFSDDFRIACTTYEEAMAAWESADSGARELGLVLNEAKTSTQLKENYVESLSTIDQRERELFASLGTVPSEGLDYWNEPADSPGDAVVHLLEERDLGGGDQPTSLTDLVHGPTSFTPEQVRAATRVLPAWLPDLEPGGRPDTTQVTTSLLRRALFVLAQTSSPNALPYVPALLVLAPALTPHVSSYLQRCGRNDLRSVERVLNDVIGNHSLSAWQAIWVSHTAGALGRRTPKRKVRIDSWLEGNLESPNQYLAAECGLALARRHAADADQLLSLLNRLAPQYRPTVMVALGAAGIADRVAEAVDSELDSIRIRWAGQFL